MADGWFEYQVEPADSDVEAVLMRHNYVRARGDDPTLLERVWMYRGNRGLQAQDRRRYLLRSNEPVMLPPRQFPEREFRTYKLTGREGSLQGVCDAIKAQHGPGALEELVPPPAQFTPEHLYDLLENRAFARKHPGGAANVRDLQQGEEVRYLVSPRRVEGRDVAPSSRTASAENELASGDAAFEVKVELATPDAEREVTLLPDGATAWQKPRARFKVTIKKKGTQEPHSVQVEVKRGKTIESGISYEPRYAMIPLDLKSPTSPEVYEIEWDGNSKEGVLDTEMLRGPFMIEVTVGPIWGVAAIGKLFLDNRAACARFVDYAVDHAKRHIKVTFYSDVEQVTNDWALWVLLPLVLAVLVVAAVLVAGAIAILLTFLLWLWDILPGSVASSGRAQLDKAEFLGDSFKVALIVTLILEAIALIVALALLFNCRLSKAEMENAKRLTRKGMEKHWSRRTKGASPSVVKIGGEEWTVEATAKNDEDRGMRLAVMKPLFSGQRGVNLAMVISILPVIVPYPDGMPLDDAGDAATPANESDEDRMKRWKARFAAERFCGTMAHEIGHSVLERDRGTDFSITHKGTTGGALDQSALPTAPEKPKEGEIDLMKYYKKAPDPTYDQFSAEQRRTVATEEDVLRIFRIARIQWRVRS